MTRRIIRVLLAAALALLPCAGHAGGQDGFFSYDGILLGAHIGGKWISDHDLQQAEPYHMHRIWGGEAVGLYGFRGWKGEGVACALDEDHPEEERGGHGQDPGLAAADGTAARVLMVQRMDAGVVRTSSAGSAELAVSGERDAMPRKPVPLGRSNEAYVRAVRECLAARGINVPQPRIAQICRVDLEGDGTDEVLIAAQDMLEDGFGEDASLYALVRGGAAPKPGGYSVLLLRRVEGSGVRTAILAESLPGSGASPAAFKICQLADLDGDGRLEMIMGEVRKGAFAYHVVTLGKKPETVLSSRLGLR